MFKPDLKRVMKEHGTNNQRDFYRVMCDPAVRLNGRGQQSETSTSRRELTRCHFKDIEGKDVEAP
ncbi:UNVERIFIED_ORG: hypothetical protein J2W87_004972 [Pseudomonas putida]|nr:hypothetical protein [Pseudomonas putida]